ncbi:MAG: metallophosphoesterase [Elusimicrobia bacterium]|nr:metallophosphoesterase [Candidatus Obscuribacterium magneticum]
MKRSKSSKKAGRFITAVVFVLVALAGARWYLGPPLPKPMPPGIPEHLQVRLEGCEFLSPHKGQVVLVAKSPSPRVVVTNTSSSDQPFTFLMKNTGLFNYVWPTPGGRSRHIPGVGFLVDARLRSFERCVYAFTPIRQPHPFEFAVVGASEGIDNPFTNHRRSYFVWNDFTKKVNNSGAHFVVHVADLLDSGRSYHWRQFVGRIRRLHVPFLPVLGNEDVSPPEGRTNFRALFGREEYSFVYQGCKFILLDTSNKTFTPDQWTWLESELKSGGTSRKLVFLHIPPWHPSERIYLPEWGESAGRRFTDLMSRTGVEAVFASHRHTCAVGVKDGVQYWITGGAGGKLDDSFAGYHYLHVRVPEKGPLEVTVVPLSNRP